MRSIVLAVVAFSLCPQPVVVTDLADAFPSLSDSAKVFLVDRVPIGSDSDHLLKVIEDLEEEPWGWSGQTTVFGVPARYKANFRNDCLYSQYFYLTVPSDVGDELFADLEALYSDRWGRAHASEGQDSPYYVISRQWCEGGLGIGMSCSLTGEHHAIGFGLQYQCAIGFRGPLLPLCDMGD